MKQQTYTSAEIIKMKLPDGYIFVNTSDNGKKPKWIIVTWVKFIRDRANVQEGAQDGRE